MFFASYKKWRAFQHLKALAEILAQKISQWPNGWPNGFPPSPSLWWRPRPPGRTWSDSPSGGPPLRPPPRDVEKNGNGWWKFDEVTLLLSPILDYFGSFCLERLLKSQGLWVLAALCWALNDHCVSVSRWKGLPRWWKSPGQRFHARSTSCQVSRLSERWGGRRTWFRMIFWIILDIWKWFE